jgi:hypothetical protein
MAALKARLAEFEEHMLYWARIEIKEDDEEEETEHESETESSDDEHAPYIRRIKDAALRLAAEEAFYAKRDAARVENTERDDDSRQLVKPKQPDGAAAWPHGGSEEDAALDVESTPAPPPHAVEPPVVQETGKTTELAQAEVDALFLKAGLPGAHAAKWRVMATTRPNGASYKTYLGPNGTRKRSMKDVMQLTV